MWSLRLLSIAGVLGSLASMSTANAQGQEPISLGFQDALPASPVVRSAGPEATAPLSLNQVIAGVLTSDPQLRIGGEEINLAIADAMTASLRPNPTVGIDGQLLPLTRPFTIAEQGGPPQFDAAVSYPVDWFLFGKRKASMASAVVGVRQTEAAYYDLIRRRIRDASVTFYDVIELKMLRDVAKQDVDNLTNVEAILRKAVAGGGRPEVDANRVRLDLLRSQQFLRDADVALNAAKARLQALLGKEAGDPMFDVVGSVDLPPSTKVPALDEAVQIARDNRPDLAAIRLGVAKAEADTTVEYRKAFPTVATKAGYSRQFQGSIGFRDADTFLVGVDIGLPLFDRNQGNRARANAQLSQNQFRVQASEVELRSELDQAIYEFKTAIRSAEAVAKDQLILAEQVRDSINKAMEAGGRPLLDVLDAQRNYRETFRLYITSRASYWRASVRLNAALGRKVEP